MIAAGETSACWKSDDELPASELSPSGNKMVLGTERNARFAFNKMVA